MRKLKLSPKTKLGRWSVGLIAAFFILFAIFQLLVGSGQQGGETFSDNLLLSIPALLMATMGIAAFVTGIIAIIKHKERSILVFISSLIGFLVLDFVLGEIFFPH